MDTTVYRFVRQLDTADENTPVTWPDEATHSVNQRRLAGPVRPNQTDDLTRGDGQGDVVDRSYPTKGYGETANLETLGLDEILSPPTPTPFPAGGFTVRDPQVRELPSAFGPAPRASNEIVPRRGPLVAFAELSWRE